MKLYRGRRTPTGCVVMVKVGSGPEEPLDPRFDVRQHADGFEFGFAGGGPAQLALALCCDVLGDVERARAVYMKLKFRIIGALNGETFELTAGELWDAIDVLEREREA